MNLGGMHHSSHQSRSHNKEEKNKYPSLYVSNLPKENFFDLDFYKFFSSRGYKVKAAKVVINQRTNKLQGYGYLQFHSKEEAERCMTEMNNTLLHGQALRIVPSLPKVEYNEKANLLVKNIDKSQTQQDLYKLFESFGRIQSCKLETFPDG
jgi:polyadenylate-binding protein